MLTPAKGFRVLLSAARLSSPLPLFVVISNQTTTRSRENRPTTHGDQNTTAEHTQLHVAHRTRTQFNYSPNSASASALVARRRALHLSCSLYYSINFAFLGFFYHQVRIQSHCATVVIQFQYLRVWCFFDYRLPSLCSIQSDTASTDRTNTVQQSNTNDIEYLIIANWAD